MRPDSHHSQEHARCCGNCRHSQLIRYKHDLLCFHNEQPTADTLLDIACMDGEEYSPIWGGRVVDHDDCCSEWEADSSLPLRLP